LQATTPNPPISDEDNTPRAEETAFEPSLPEGSELQRLQQQLASYPEIASRVPVRLEAPLKESLDELCSTEKITIETLLEAFYVTCKDKDTVMRQVIKEAKKRLKHRKEAGNIRSSITRLTHLISRQK
jgi:hypothetical protein